MNTPTRLSYAETIAALPAAYARARAADVAPLRAALGALGAAPGGALFAGSGGMAAVARLAADLHERAHGRLARCLTLAELCALPRLHGAGALVVTVGARHPDAELALRALAGGGYSPAVAVSGRAAGEVAAVAGAPLAVVELPGLGVGDGFLATRSVLELAVLLTRAQLGDDALPARLPLPAAEPTPARPRLLMLAPPPLAAAGEDLEARLAETGLTAAQLCDPRALAHGRFVGLDRHADETSVLLLRSPRTARLVDATARALRSSGLDIHLLAAEGPEPAALIALLAGSMRLVDRLAGGAGIDPARPRVPVYGRRLHARPAERWQP